MASRHITPAPGSADYEDQIAEYGRDIRPQQYAAITICAAAATIAVALRLYTQRRFRKQWGLDDALILMALVIVWAQMIASILSLVHGAGLHQVRVLLEDQHAPNGLQSLYTAYWIVSVLWAPAIMCIKLSILIVYRRIFLGNQRWFKIALWANGFYALGLGIASTFVFIFQCSPVDYYWTRFVAFYGYPAPEGGCLPQMAHLVTPQILSTASDLVILLLPIPVIWGLHVENSRKIPVFLVFLLGAFTVGCGIARISVIFHVSNVVDVTWNNIDTVTFTVVECGVGIVCACMPPSAPLYTSFLRGQHDVLLPKESASAKYNSGPQASHKASFFRQRKSEIMDNTDLEFQGLVPGTKTQAWSHPAEANRSGSGYNMKQGCDMIRVDHRVEWSSTRTSSVTRSESQE